jgi:hypothetical protein
MMKRFSLVGAGALFACFSALAPSAVQADDFVLKITVKSENGKVAEMPTLPGGNYTQCQKAKKNNEVGKVIPRGVLVSPGGKSYAATIIAVKCVPTVGLGD